MLQCHAPQGSCMQQEAMNNHNKLVPASFAEIDKQDLRPYWLWSRQVGAQTKQSKVDSDMALLGESAPSFQLQSPGLGTVARLSTQSYLAQPPRTRLSHSCSNLQQMFIQPHWQNEALQVLVWSLEAYIWIYNNHSHTYGSTIITAYKFWGYHSPEEGPGLKVHRHKIHFVHLQCDVAIHELCGSSKSWGSKDWRPWF